MNLLLLVLAAAPALPVASTSPEPERQLLRAIYEELVTSNTSYETGKTTPAAEAMAKRLLEAGFAREDVFVGGAAPHKANLVARYRGTGGARPLLTVSTCCSRMTGSSSMPSSASTRAAGGRCAAGSGS
jgi:hypothetical protein